ncbi:MAG: nucleotidyltransferase [Clostridiales bacterium]|nr:nucleotidyltransferase [Clostridiales bacterium]
MKVLGIVAEYNPFHKGHLFHLAESKRMSGAGACVAVMSGNFTQRGEVAFFDKWERARIAVDCGVDLVLELPFAYACNTAEHFAKGAVQILDGLSCVDAMSFGSESGDLTKLSESASCLLSEDEKFRENLKSGLEKGDSFPKARAGALRLAAGEEIAEMLSSPNNILAVEYLKQLMLAGSSLAPLTVRREGAGHNSKAPSGGFSSAASIRGMLGAGGMNEASKYVPDECYDRIKKINIGFNEKINNLFLLISAKIFSETEEKLEETLSAGEGLGCRLKKAARGADCLESLVSGTKSKRYTRTRIQRLLVHALFDLKAADFHGILDAGLNYARVLAFNAEGAALLRRAKGAGTRIPVITNINKQVRDGDEIFRLLKYDLLASDLYNLVSGSDTRVKSDFVVPPYHKF